MGTFLKNCDLLISLLEILGYLQNGVKTKVKHKTNLSFFKNCFCPIHPTSSIYLRNFHYFLLVFSKLVFYPLNLIFFKYLQDFRFHQYINHHEQTI